MPTDPNAPPARGLPARVIEIPADVALTDDEIVKLLETANERKTTGDPGFDITTVLDGEFYTLKVPKEVMLARDEIISALTRLNHACEFGNADVLFVFASGRMAKRGWITLKDETDRSLIQSGGIPLPRQF